MLDRLAPQVVVSVLTRSNFIDVLRIVRHCRRRRLPLVLWVGNLEPAERGALSERAIDLFSERYFKRSIAGARGFVFYSQKSAEWAARRGARGTSVVGGQVLAASAHSLRLQEPSEGAVIGLFVGKLEPRKGVLRLLELLTTSNLPEIEVDFELQFVGSGPLADDIRRVRPRNPRVRLAVLGPLYGEALEERFRTADFLLLPSLHEPWGFVVNEAMARGTPVLCSNRCGASELAAQAGWVFDVSDQSSFADGLARAIRECRKSGIRVSAAHAEAQLRPEAFVRDLVPMLRDLSERGGHR
jgi:glycosyltransferase involved in cell wall biosynthesis